MRLWHEKLIPHLPRQQLLGQHRELAALRGNGWGKKHKTVDYVWKYNLYRLALFHKKVLDEMIKRGYKPDMEWKYQFYRGKNCEPVSYKEILKQCSETHLQGKYIYPEHNKEYLEECLQNLKEKGIDLYEKVTHGNKKCLTKRR